jgi:hypothetical protein
MARKPAQPKVEIVAGPPVLEPSRFAAPNRRRLSGPGLRTFLAISDLWGLTEGERLLVLGLPSRSTYYGWVRAAKEHRDVTLDLDVLTRISAILGIHQALGILQASEPEAIAWLRTSNRALPFAGQPPMRLVASGTQDGLMAVRRFLDAARGGNYMAPNAIDQNFQPYADADVIFT